VQPQQMQEYRKTESLSWETSGIKPTKQSISQAFATRPDHQGFEEQNRSQQTI
jgi:hypothetical protein